MKGFQSQFTKEESNNVFDKVEQTFEDLMNQIIIGTASRLESIKDTALTTVGLVGGMFDKRFKQSIQDVVAQESEFIQAANTYQNTQLQGSYINDMGQGGQDIVRGTAQAVGGMIPALLSGQVAGAFGLSAKAATAISRATFFASAAGGSTEQALNEGATFNQAASYGGLSGGVELLTESLFGGLTTNIFGKGMLDNTLRIVNKSKVAKLAFDVAGEGLEEALAEFVNPVLQKMTYNEDAKFWDENHKQAVLQAAIIGGLTSIAYGRTLGRMQSPQSDILSDVQEIGYLDKKVSKEFSRGISKDSTIEDLSNAKKTLSEKLVKMDEATRASRIKDYQLNQYFNEDGSVIETNKVSSEATTPQARIGKLPDVKIAQKVNEQQKSTLQLGAKLGYRVVIADDLKTSSGEDANGYYDADTKTIAISSKNSNPSEVFVHELTHTLEGTKEYAKFADFVLNESKSNELLKAKINDLGIDLESIRELYANQGKTQLGKNYVALTEYIAYATSEVLFKDADTVNRMVESQERSTVQKIYNWVKKTVKKLSSTQSMSKDERAYLTMLKKAEKLYAKALENPTDGIKVSDIDNAATENKRYSIDDLRKISIRKAMANELLNSESVFLGFTPQFLKDLGLSRGVLSITQQHLRDVVATPKDSYKGKHAIPLSYIENDLINDLSDPMIAFDLGNNKIGIMSDKVDVDGSPIYMPIKYNATSVINKVEIEANHISSIYGRDGFDKYIMNNFDKIMYINKEKTRELFKRSGNNYPNRLNSLVDKSILSQIDAKVNNKRYSIEKDSLGNDLTNEQKEFFKNTQIVDKDGNLLTLYHGTPFKKFHTFKGEMFFFSTSEKFAEEYAQDKSFDNAMDADISVYEVYLKGEKLFDTRNTDLVASLVDKIDVENMTLGFNNKKYTRKQWVDAILGNVVDDPMWKKEQIDKAKFGEVIGEDKYGYNNDRFIGIDSDNNVVHVRGYHADHLKYLTESQIEDLLKGKKAKVRLVKGRWDAESYKEAFGYDASSWEFETQEISPYKTTQETVQLSNQDNWVNLELTYDAEAKKSIVDYIKDEGYDSIKMFENGQENYAIFKPNQVKLTTNKNPSKSDDMRYSKKDDTLIKKYPNIDLNQDISDYDGVPAIQLNDGSIIPSKSGLTHVQIIKNNNVDVNDIDNGGWISNGVYDAFSSSDTMRYVRQEQAKVRLEEKKNQRYSLSKGQIAKKLADYTKAKKYTKKDAEKVVNTILNEFMVFENMDGDLPSMNRKEVIEQLWIELNSKDEGQRGRVALDIAKYVIENAIAEDIYSNDMTRMDVEFINFVKGYKGQIIIDSLKGDIKNHFGKDNSPLQTWGKRKNNAGIDIETIALELKDMGIFLEGNTGAELFVDLHTKYKQAQENLKTTAKELRSEISSSEYLELKNNIVREVLSAWDNYGKATVLNKEITKYQGIVKNLKTRLADARQMSFAVSKMFKTIDRVSALEKYQSVEDIPLSKEIVSMVKMLRKIKTWRGNLASANAVRDIFRKYSSLVVDENGKKIPLYNLYHKMNNDETFGADNPYADLIQQITTGEGQLTASDFDAIDQILTNFIFNVKNYDKVFFEGKEQSMKELVEKAVFESQETIPVPQKPLGTYKRWIESPIWRFERLSNFKKDGYFFKVYRELHEGVSKQAEFKRDVAEHYKEFFKKHRKVIDTWRDATSVINGVEVSRGQLIALHMLAQREQAQTHLFNINEVSGNIRIANEKLAKQHRQSESVNQGKDTSITFADVNNIKFTELELEYIKLTEQFFNELSKNAKTDTDVKLFGVTNVEEGKYFPIRVSDDVLYKQIGDANGDFNNLFSVYSASFNKAVKRNANNKVVIENVLDVVERHTQQMSAYYGLAIPIKSFNRVWNKKLDNSKTVKTEVAKVDPNFQKYVGKLLQDIQGARVELSTFDRNFGKIRGWWARAALGLNPKVWTTQFASLWAAGGVGIKYRHLVKGLGQGIVGKTDYDNLYKYSPMLYDRARDGNNVDVGLLKRDAGLLGHVDKLTDLTTKPIGMIDNLVVGSVWNASLEQTKSKDYADYSEEHYKAAAKLTELAVMKTQANWSPLYRPDILRTQSSLLQSITMFASEPLQVFSQLAGSIEKIKIAKKLGDADLLKEANAEAKHYGMSITLNALFLTMVGMTFKWIKFGDDDEEEWWESALQELAGHFIGIFPIFRDFYSLWQGYELTNMYETGVNNMYKGFTSLSNIVSNGIFGKEAYDGKDFKRDSRQLILGISQTFGVPLKNLETYTKGILEKFNESMVYKYEDNFFKQTYTKDLEKAIEKGDDKLADTIIDMMFREKNVTVTDPKTKDLITSLYKEGYSVMPRAVMDTIVIDDENVKLTQKQFKEFKGIYNQADAKVNSISKIGAFRTLSDEGKAKAIKYVYDYQYNLAKENLTGEEYSGSFGAVANYVAAEKLAIIKAYSNTINADYQYGSVVNGSKKIKIKMMLNRMGLTVQQKALIMGYLGYAQDYTTMNLEPYVRSQSVSKTQLETLLNYI